MQNSQTTSNEANIQQILIVDDCAVIRAVVQQYLERAGYAVEIAESGHQALEVLKGKQFDLILMDLVMPGMDGYEATKRIRNSEFGMGNGKIKQSKIKSEFTGSDHKCACRVNKDQSQEHSCSEKDCKCRRTGSDQNSKSEIRNPKSEINEVPIIGISGHDPESVMDECCRSGMNDCIGKPLERESLVAVVRKWTAAEIDSPQNQSATEKLNRPHPPAIENQPPIDMEKTITEFQGQTDVLWEVLHTFKTRVRAQIMNIKQHIGVKNFDPILSEAHAIKGGAGNLGAFNLSRAAAELEEAAGQKSSARANAAVDDLENEFQHLYHYIEQSDMGKAISK